MRATTLLFSALLLARGAAAAEPAPPKTDGKILAVYRDHGATKLFLEADQPLIAGGVVYIGAKKLPAVIGGLLSRTETHYYYNATTDAQADVASGDALSLEPPKTLAGASIFSLEQHETYNFDQKHLATILAVQGDRAMINRGTLQEVRERDLYRVYNASGAYKGLLELHGLGDSQSSGTLYNAFEDTHRTAATTDVGDQAVYAGQRKFLGIGVIGAERSSYEKVITQKESAFGMGLVCDATFRDGLGLEVLFGAFVRDGQESQNMSLGGGNSQYEQMTHQAAFVAPVWVKKNFFYPRAVSPFIAAGASMVTAVNSFNLQTFSGSSSNAGVSGSKKVTSIAPMVGAGLEFFQGYFFRPRIEVRYFDGPKVTTEGNTFNTSSLYYAAGFVMGW